MTILKNCLVLALTFLIPIHIVGQVNNPPDLTPIFGTPARNPCIVGKNGGLTKSCNYYKFNGEYSIGVERDKNLQILKIYLTPKSNVEDLEEQISNAEKKRFLELVGKARSLGTSRLDGTNRALAGGGGETWEVYENALVLTSHDKWNGREYEPSRITVFFPTHISGVISAVEDFAIGTEGLRIKVVHIEACTYLSTQKELKAGTEGTFPLVGPRNNCALDRK